MRHITIPGTDLSATVLCLGTADFGGSTSPTMVVALLDAYLRAGGNFIDTAKVYNDWLPGERSRSEKLIGEWMLKRRNRHQVILATKGAHFELSTPHIPRLTASDIANDVDASLKHLQTEWIDLYWLHRDDPGQPVEDVLEGLENQVRNGKIRNYGCSNWRAERVEAARQAALQNSWKGFVAVQNMWSLAQVNREAISDPTIVMMDNNLWDLHWRNQIMAIPFSSQAGGFFQKLEKVGVAGVPKNMQAVYLNPVSEQRFIRLQEIKQQTGWSTTQIVLGYLLSQPFPVIPIFSARNMDQLEDTLRAADTLLTPDQVTYLADGLP